MTKKKKQQMGMIITLCIVLCGLGIGYFLAAKKQQQKEDEAKKSEITLYSLKEDDITTLHYKNGTADITFVKEDKSWKLKDDKAFSVNQSKDVYVVASNVTSDFEYTRNQLMKVPDAPDIDLDRVNVYQVKTAKGESFTAKKVTQKA